MLQTIICNYCQGSIKDSDRFCYYCGEPVSYDIKTSDVPQTPTALPPADKDRQTLMTKETMPSLAAATGLETVPDDNLPPLNEMPAATLPPNTPPPPQNMPENTEPEKTDLPASQTSQPVFDSFELQAAPLPEQAPPAEVAVTDKPPEPPLQALSVPQENAEISGTLEPQIHTPKVNQVTTPEAGILTPDSELSQPQNDSLRHKKEQPPEIAPATGFFLQGNQKTKNKAVKPTKTVTRLKANPLAKTRMQVKVKAKIKVGKPQAEKTRLPFYFRLPHMCTLFSMLMLLLTAVSFYGFSSSMGVFFLFPCWPLGLLLFAALMFFTPLQDPQAPRGVNFFIKLNLVYNVFMLVVSGSIMLNGDQHLTVWLFVWFAGGFILPLSIMFLNRQFMRYTH